MSDAEITPKPTYLKALLNCTTDTRKTVKTPSKTYTTNTDAESIKSLRKSALGSCPRNLQAKLNLAGSKHEVCVLSR